MSVATASSGSAQELARICGPEHVAEDPTVLQELAIDEIVPSLAISPASAEEIAAILRIAAERNLVVVPSGGFTAHWAAIPERIDILLYTNRLSEIVFYDPGDLTLGAGAGCTAAQISSKLTPNRQFLPFDVPQAKSATVGGILATATDGPLRHAYGGVRDFCIGISFVTGDGKIAKGGGRVVKNVTGYDLMKLMIGSHGTLGIITSANFKVFPMPQQTRTFLMEFTSHQDAIAARHRIMRSPLTPMCLEIVSPRALEYLEPTQPARDPDHFAPELPLPRPKEKWQLVLRAAGSDRVLARYRNELGSDVSRELEADEEEQLWRGFAEFTSSVLTRHHNAMIVQLNTLPSTAERAIQAAETAALNNNLLPSIIGRIGLGALVLALVPLAVDPPSAMQYATAISALRADLPAGSSAVVTVCPTEAKRHFDVWGPSFSDLPSMRAVKRALDPGNILNRGRFLV